MNQGYAVVEGTYYHQSTKPEIVKVLEHARKNNLRIIIEYGDIQTGRLWGDKEIGYIGRSMGPVKIPIILHNKRSSGGGALLDHCVVNISHANKKNGRVLYQGGGRGQK